MRHSYCCLHMGVILGDNVGRRAMTSHNCGGLGVPSKGVDGVSSLKAMKCVEGFLVVAGRAIL